jgi:hypothetical protein
LDTNDLVLDDSSLNIVFTDLDQYITQKIKNRLLFLKGEWFLDVSLGIPYFESVFEKGTDYNFLTLIFRSELLKINGITDILEFELTQLSAREFSIYFKVSYIDNIIEGVVEI